MTTLREIVKQAEEQEQRVLIDTSGMPITSSFFTELVNPQRVKEFTDFLESTNNVYTIRECVEELKPLIGKTSKGVKKSKRERKTNAQIKYNLQNKRKFKKRRNERVEDLISSLNKRLLNLEEMPPYLKLRKIVFLLENVLKYRHKSVDNGLRTDERIIAAAYFFALHGDGETIIISNDEALRRILQGSINTLSSPEFEPENELLLSNLRSERRVKLYRVNELGEYYERFNTGTCKPTPRPGTLTPNQIAQIKKDLDYKLDSVPN